MSSQRNRYFDAPHFPAAGVERPLKLAIGGWSLVRLVSDGPLACVYQARPARGSDDRPPAYAFKLLRERFESDDAAVAAMRNEARVAKLVRHPRLVTILAAHVEHAPYYIVMPWLNGETLDRRLVRLRPTLPVALWIARQAAEALDGLYQLGWMHGDVKASNLMVSPEGHTTLLDLGFACRLGESFDAAPAVAGTLEYLAPEKIVSAAPADIRSDLYSLGIVLFEMLAGRRPFVGDVTDLVRQHCQCAPANLQRLDPSIPREVSVLVADLLAKEPLRRPQSPRELIDRLIDLEVTAFSQRHELAQVG
jgi:serine/threonine-protein kinase